MLQELAAKYAKLAGEDASEAEEFIINFRDKMTKRRKMRRWLKKKLGSVEILHGKFIG
jgi:hypothetical protein